MIRKESLELEALQQRFTVLWKCAFSVQTGAGVTQKPFLDEVKCACADQQRSGAVINVRTINERLKFRCRKSF